MRLDGNGTSERHPDSPTGALHERPPANRSSMKGLFDRAMGGDFVQLTIGGGSCGFRPHIRETIAQRSLDIGNKRTQQ